MMMIGILVLMALARCSAQPTTTPHSIVLTVVNAADTSMALPGVDVSVFTACGQVRPLGMTDRFGRISVSTADIKGTSYEVILFCHYGFFCGAIKTRESRIPEFDEYLVALAPITVR
jgi:hypothetical protein